MPRQITQKMSKDERSGVSIFPCAMGKSFGASMWTRVLGEADKALCPQRGEGNAMCFAGR